MDRTSSASTNEARLISSDFVDNSISVLLYGGGGLRARLVVVLFWCVCVLVCVCVCVCFVSSGDFVVSCFRPAAVIRNELIPSFLSLSLYLLSSSLVRLR